MTTNDAEKSNKEKADTPTLEMKRLSAECSRAAFSCGNRDIDGWFRSKALKHHNRLRCRVVTGHFINNPSPAGFYAMGMRMEKESDLPDAQRPFFPWGRGSSFPALHLQYVAVQRQLQKRKFGTVLMGAAIDDFYEVAIRAGVFALTLTAIDPKTAEFYRKLGFIDFGPKDASQPNLLLPAASVIEAKNKLLQNEVS